MKITRKHVRAKSKNIYNSCNILLIEDQISIANMVVNMLERRWGFNVIVAKSYEQTKDLLTKKDPEIFLTISDLNLPDANNGEIIDLLIEHKQKVVAITGSFDQKLHATLSKKGVIDYVLKNNIHAYEYLVNLIGRLYLNQFIKVMVIDDSESIQQLSGSYLEKQFLNVIYAKNGEEGLALLQAQPDIKLVMVDSEMPVMDGLTFTAKARKYKDQNNLSILGISSTGGVDLSAQFLKHGANDFISKPFTYDELTCRVNQNLNMLNYIQEMDKVANMDFLTQLPNRRYFFSRGETILQEAINEKKHCVVAIMDIDFFKSINDQYGHDCGDEVLREVASSIKAVLANQLVARIGGEEFAMVISAKNFNESNALLMRMMENIRQKSIAFNDHVINVAVSIGATYQLDNSLDVTLKMADQHLYVAKHAGRNQLVWNHGQPQILEPSIPSVANA